MKESKKKQTVSTVYKRFNYKFFTDYWVIVVLLIFYLMLEFNIVPSIFAKFYAPVILLSIKMLWTKTSNIKIFDDKLIFHHKEIPTYLREEILATDIDRIRFKTFIFSFSEKEYCLITKKSAIKKDILINISHFSRPRMVKEAIIDFAKRNKIKINVF